MCVCYMRDTALIGSEQAFEVWPPSALLIQTTDRAAKRHPARLLWQAVKRLQRDCDHQLELERNRTREAERLKALAEEKALVAEGKAERIEHAFDAYRAEQRNTPEAALQSEIARLTHCKQVCVCVCFAPHPGVCVGSTFPLLAPRIPHPASSNSWMMRGVWKLPVGTHPYGLECAERRVSFAREDGFQNGCVNGFPRAPMTLLQLLGLWLLECTVSVFPARCLTYGAGVPSPSARQAAEQKAVVVARAKGKYKEQVRRLAVQLATMQKAHVASDARAQKMLAVQQVREKKHTMLSVSSGSPGRRVRRVDTGRIVQTVRGGVSVRLSGTSKKYPPPCRFDSLLCWKREGLGIRVRSEFPPVSDVSVLCGGV